MTDAERLTETPPGVRLCALSDIPDRSARNFVLQLRRGRFFGFVVRHGELIRGYVDRCPHMGLPLATALDQYLTPSKENIVCSWHGALFRLEDGHCIGGPCPGANLTIWPVEVVEGSIQTV